MGHNRYKTPPFKFTVTWASTSHQIQQNRTYQRRSIVHSPQECYLCTCNLSRVPENGHYNWETSESLLKRSHVSFLTGKDVVRIILRSYSLTNGSLAPTANNSGRKGLIAKHLASAMWPINLRSGINTLEAPRVHECRLKSIWLKKHKTKKTINCRRRIPDVH